MGDSTERVASSRGANTSCSATGECSMPMVSREPRWALRKHETDSSASSLCTTAERVEELRHFANGTRTKVANRPGLAFPEDQRLPLWVFRYSFQTPGSGHTVS